MKRNHFSLISVILIFLLCLVSSSIMAQKVNLDSLDIDQLNVYKNKAVKMRNTGIYETCIGAAIVATGFIITGIKKKNVTDPNDNMEEIADAIPAVLGSLVGLPVTLAGLTLSSIGANRKIKAEIALKSLI